MRHLMPLVLCIGCGGPQTPPVPEPESHFVVQTKTITARSPLPNVMLLLDRSATMTRLADVQSVTAAMLTKYAAGFRAGLAAFPSDGACGAGQVLVDVPGDPSAIVGSARALTLQGGAPIAASLRAIELSDVNREDFVALITGNEESCGGDPVEAVRELRQKNVRTIVIPFGIRSATLDAMAIAGGFQRTCPSGSDAECGAGGCDPSSNVCNQPAWNASDGAELSRVFDSVFYTSPAGNYCRFTLVTKPVSSGHVMVYLDGRQLFMGPETWLLNGEQVEFLGAACDRLNNSTPDSPVKLEFRINIWP